MDKKGIVYSGRLRFLLTTYNDQRGTFLQQEVIDENSNVFWIFVPLVNDEVDKAIEAYGKGDF